MEEKKKVSKQIYFEQFHGIPISLCIVFLKMGSCRIYHGGLYSWRGNSFPFFFRNKKLKEILIRLLDFTSFKR